MFKPLIPVSALLLASGVAQAQVTQLVSLDSSGTQSSQDTHSPAISANGDFVAFHGRVGSFHSPDLNGTDDVFVRDLQAGTTEAVSVTPSGATGNGKSQLASISGDGRYVCFHSIADDLVTGDTNFTTDMFVRDRLLGTTSLVSVSSTGGPSNGSCYEGSISDDGTAVAFSSGATNHVLGDTNGQGDVFVRDLVTGTTELVSVSTLGVQGNNSASLPRISGDGRYVIFRSYATNLVLGDTNGSEDLFVHDRVTGVTELVGVSSTGVQGNNGTWHFGDINGDGSLIVFSSLSDNLVPGDTNGLTDIFLRNRTTGLTSRVSVNSYGGESLTGASTYGSYEPRISADGSTVIYSTYATDLFTWDFNNSPDVMAHDLDLGLTELVSLSSTAARGAGSSGVPSVSGDGRIVAFRSSAHNLVPADVNHKGLDCFTHDRMTGGAALNMTNLVGGQTATLTVTGGTPGGLVGFGISLVGQGPVPSPWGPVELSAPIFTMTLPLDGAGSLTLPVNVPVGVAGIPLWIQGVDFGSNYPTNPWGGLMQ